mmetsp:Transcript_12886/g.16468  ORF Transcript_12886/g.16468 Transcript_12886/m.16468 type:complete len:202 (-) Transcript_12886:1153-1758(-)
MVRTTHAPLLPSVEQITGRVSTSPQPNNNTPRRYKLTPIERNLRGKEYSGTFRLRNKTAIDVPNYSAKERAKFVDNFTAEVNNKFSGRQTNKKQTVENDHMARVFEKLMTGGSINDDGVPDRPLASSSLFARCGKIFCGTSRVHLINVARLFVTFSACKKKFNKRFVGAINAVFFTARHMSQSLHILLLHLECVDSLQSMQ